MAKDVEMKEAGTGRTLEANGQSDGKKTGPADSEEEILAGLNSCFPLIERGVSQKEVRLMARAVRQIVALRRQLKAHILSNLLDHSLPPNSEVHSRLSNYLSAAPGEMEIESGATTEAQKADGVGPSKGAVLPEIEAFLQLLVLIFLIDQKLLEEAKKCSVEAVNYLHKLNRRTLDLIAARIYFYYALAHERTNSLAEIRSSLLALNRTATLRHDEIGQETLVNLILRNYLYSNLYDQAEKFRSKIQRPESHSNQQLCRYLYYLGRIRAIQLEYTDAKDCLLQAVRKAPLKARGFRIACTKWAVIVRLLLGEIPERTTFMVPGMRTAMQPYFELTNAVRIGDLELFRSVADKHIEIFQRDRTHNLIVRLRHNVIRTGLRRVNISYSRISLADVAAKLRLDSSNPVADVESIVAKAISDGGIDAAVDHKGSFMQSKETADIYSTVEPQAAFHSRIAFCLNTHNEAVRAMRFPPEAEEKNAENGEKQRERQQQVQELAKHMAEEDDF